MSRGTNGSAQAVTDSEGEAEVLTDEQIKDLAEKTLEVGRRDPALGPELAAMEQKTSLGPDSLFCPANKDIIVLRDGIFVLRNEKGRGCYAQHSFVEGDLLEECPVMAFPDGAYAENSAINRYVWGWRGGQCIALGMIGSILNHVPSYSEANVRASYDFEKGTITFTVDRDVAPGDEFLVCYALFYPMGPGTGSLARMLGEMNTAVVADIDRRKKEWIASFEEDLEKCPKSKAYWVAHNAIARLRTEKT